MIESSISSSHHYYLVFFESEHIKTVMTIYSLFKVKKNIVNKENLKFIHAQILLEAQYGSEAVLNENKVISKAGGISYWYDLYIGSVTQGKRSINYICYPYNALTKVIETTLNAANLQISYYKPILQNILTYMRTRGEKNKPITNLEQQGFDFDIIKYTAEVKEEINAKRVNIVGDNPLNSKIYEVLEKDKDIIIRPISLKMKCKKLEVGEIEVSFDKLGKYRFWLKRNYQEMSLPMLSYLFAFFQETNSLEQASYISSLTLLEDE